MKNEEKKIYSEPELKVVEVIAERGFELSCGEYPDPFDGSEEIPW